MHRHGVSLMFCITLRSGLFRNIAGVTAIERSCVRSRTVDFASLRAVVCSATSRVLRQFSVAALDLAL